MSVALLMNALIYASMLVLLAQAHTLTYVTADAPNFTVGPVAAIRAYRTKQFYKKHIYNKVTPKTQLLQQES